MKLITNIRSTYRWCESVGTTQYVGWVVAVPVEQPEEFNSTKISYNEIFVRRKDIKDIFDNLLTCSLLMAWKRRGAESQTQSVGWVLLFPR